MARRKAEPPSVQGVTNKRAIDLMDARRDASASLPEPEVGPGW
jgi:hypothetical protein